MSKTLKIIIAIVGLIILWLLTLYFRRTPIEQDLTYRVEEMLNRSDFSKVDISFKGRDGTLSGEVSTQSMADEAETMAKETWGVRVVNDLVSVAAEQLAELTHLEGHFQNSRFVLKGAVPDEASRAKLVKLAEKAFGIGLIVDQFNIDPQVQIPDYFEKAFKVFLGLMDIQDAGFSIGADKFVLKGKVETEAIKTALGDELKKILAPLLVQNDLQVLTFEVNNLSLDELRSYFESNPIEFEFNSASLNAQSRQTLNRIAALLQQNMEPDVQIEGHTDKIGSNSYNLQLGQKRANSAKSYLVEKNIVASRLTTKSYGETQPKALNDTEAGRQRNRRVEIRLK